MRVDGEGEGGGEGEDEGEGAHRAVGDGEEGAREAEPRGGRERVRDNRRKGEELGGEVEPAERSDDPAELGEVEEPPALAPPAQGARRSAPPARRVPVPRRK